jgi:hypothetical protein
MDADDRQRPILEHREDPIAHGVEVLDQVPLRRAGSVKERLIEVGQRNALA